MSKLLLIVIKVYINLLFLDICNVGCHVYTLKPEANAVLIETIHNEICNAILSESNNRTEICNAVLRQFIEICKAVLSQLFSIVKCV